MLATRTTITNYIPQRDPIVMVHDLLETDDEHVVTQLLIEPGNIFVSGGFLREPGLVENIAQTAAVQVGYQCMLRNIPVPVGYIAAVKNLKIIALPEQNSAVTTSVRIVQKVMDITVAEGKVMQGDTVLCSCEMKIFVKV